MYLYTRAVYMEMFRSGSSTTASKSSVRSHIFATLTHTHAVGNKNEQPRENSGILQLESIPGIVFSVRRIADNFVKYVRK